MTDPTPGKHIEKTPQSPTRRGRRTTLIFSDEDSCRLDDLVRIGIFDRWPNANRSTISRAILAVVAAGYSPECIPISPAASELHAAIGRDMEELPSLSLLLSALKDETAPINTDTPPVRPPSELPSGSALAPYVLNAAIVEIPNIQD